MLGRFRNWAAVTLSATHLPAPFYVVSHERSGTHFLINTLLNNAVLHPEYHDSSEWLGPYASGQNSQFSHIDFLRANWDQITGDCSIIKIHSDRDLFDFRYPKAKVAYVLRDPRDTLVSFCLYLKDPPNKTFHWLADHQYSSMSDFLRRPLSSYLRWCYSRGGTSDNVAERWAAHVKGWLATDDTVVVRYEELKTDYRRVLGRLSAFLNLELLPALSPVGLHEGFSVAPRRGVIGDWRNHLTADDEALVRDAVERAGVDWGAVTWRE
jgi:hypothetical protein